MKHLDKEITNESSLIASAKSGNTHSVELLYEKYKVYLRSLARKYFLVDGDLDDLTQEGTMAFLHAINTYDKAKNDNFKAYMTMVVNRQLINKIKSSTRLKNLPLNERYNLNSQGEVEFDDDVVALKSDSPTPEENTISDENIKDIFSEIESKLSKYELQILSLYLQGHVYTDIATMLGKSNKSVDNALTRIKSKLRNLKED
ncbi:MAG: sigma-70 family RNA polymerase sigma factor [Clostridia bacterium]|nr:sigma-70 family RNA polymerase sigma factor [Clostridia bacterium]